MRRYFSMIAVLFAAIFILSESTSTAVERQFEERFTVNGQIAKNGDAGTYNFDRAHSFIGFKVKHMGLIEVPGYFRDFTGTVNYDNKDITKSSVEFTAQVTSVDTGVDGRDAHLRRADFFEVEKYPTLTFKSTSVAKKGSGFVVTGDLTMRGVTKPVSIPFELTGFLPGNDRNGMRMGIVGETTLNRRDFGVNYGGNLPGTDIPQIADNIRVVLQIEAVQPKAAARAAATQK